MPNRFPPNYIIYAAAGVVKPYIKNIMCPLYKKLMSSFAFRRRKNSKTSTVKNRNRSGKSKQRQKNRTRTGAKKHNAEKEENTRAKAKKRTYGEKKQPQQKKAYTPEKSACSETKNARSVRKKRARIEAIGTPHGTKKPPFVFAKSSFVICVIVVY